MSQTKRLSIVLGLNLAMIAGLVGVGVSAHSLGVLAAGGDFVADSLAIILGIFAVYLRDRRNFKQAPTYVALINGTLLLVVIIFVITQSINRLTSQNPEVHGIPVLIVSSISAFVMAIGVYILGKGAGNEDLHMRSVLLDTMSDGLSAAAVAVVGGIIFFSHGLYWLDSVAALAISFVIGYGAVKLLKEVANSLFKGVPLKIKKD